jgi:ferrous iron transport protein A
MLLSQLSTGDKGQISRLCGDTEITSRLIEMGLVKGAEFEMVRRAPLGDPLEIKLKGFLLSLRLSEADFVEVEGIYEKN